MWLLPSGEWLGVEGRILFDWLLEGGRKLRNDDFGFCRHHQEMFAWSLERMPQGMFMN